LDDALDKIRMLGRSVGVAASHEERTNELKQLIGEARRALVLSASVASATDSPSGIIARSGARSASPASTITPREWLLRSVVHDLNNMLLVIQNCSETLRQHDTASVEREALVVQDAVSQATRLVAKLLPAEPGVGRAAGVDLSECIRRFAGVVATLVGPRIDVVSRLAEGLAPVRCEETAIFRVLSNLATNARDAMAGGGTLALETCAAESSVETQFGEGPPRSYVLLSVTDTGEGMDAVTSERAFEPFFTTKQPGQGTGVGLTAVREIVQSVGGFVHMETSPGRGTTVRVYLACADAPAS
jgi:signal transduction histidine kinase